MKPGPKKGSVDRRQMLRARVIARKIEKERQNSAIIIKEFEPGKIKSFQCKRCGCKTVKIVCPIGFPIATIALACWKCGRIPLYIDNLLLVKGLDAVQLFSKRPWVVRKGVAIRPTSADACREIVMMGIECGLSADLIAQELNMDVGFVTNIMRTAR